MSKTRNFSFRWELLPILLLLLFLPLCVRTKILPSGLTGYAWYGNKATVTDAFLYYRGILLAVAALFMGVILVIRRRELSLSGERAFLPLLLYMGLVLLSAVCSKYPQFAWGGMIDLMEPAWVLLCYGVIDIYCCTVIRNKEDINTILLFLFVGMLLNTGLGLTQFLGHDFWRTSLGQSLRIPSAIREELTETTYYFDKSAFNSVYMGFYNPNYVGMYGSLLTPVLIGVIAAAKRNRVKIIVGVSTLLFVFTVLCSGSKSFFLAMFLTLLVGAALYGGNVKHKGKLLAGALAFIILTLTAYRLYTGNSFLQYVKNAFQTKENNQMLTDIYPTDEGVRFDYAGRELLAGYQDAAGNYFITLQDASAGLLPLEQAEETGVQKVDDPELDGIRLAIFQYKETGVTGLQITTDGFDWHFTQENGSYTYVSGTGKPDKMISSPSALPERWNGFASGRGFIWSKTIPLLKSNLFLGSGPDTFPLVFPHNDYLDRYHGGFGDILIFKPHNYYLQVAVQTGMLSLLSILAFFGLYLRDSWKTYHRGAGAKNTEHRKRGDAEKADDVKSDRDAGVRMLGMAISLGVVCYLIASLTCDSSVSMAPYFWILLGVGFACNRLARETPITDSSKETENR